MRRGVQQLALVTPTPQSLLLARARFAASDAKAGAQSTRFSGAPGEPQTFKDKARKELKTVLKMQLVLMPIMFLGMMWMYPPVNKAEEKRLREQYERSAGWKT